MASSTASRGGRTGVWFPVGNWFPTSSGSFAQLVLLRNHVPMTSLTPHHAPGDAAFAAPPAIDGEIALSLGAIQYQDTGGAGPVVVLLPGLLMDESLWQDVVAELAPIHRCIVPT